MIVFGEITNQYNISSTLIEYHNNIIQVLILMTSMRTIKLI